jgi:type IV secretory pathway VirJ component
VGALATLIMYLVIAGSLAAGYGLWRHNISSEAAKKQLEKDAIVLNVSKKDTATAVDANKTLQEQLAVIKKDISDRNLEIGKMEEQLRQSKALLTELTAKNRPVILSLLKDRNDALARAANSVIQNCEETLSVITKNLSSLVTREMKDRPPSPTKEDVKSLFQLSK